MSRASQLLAVALLLPLLFAARGVAQEEPEPTPPPADSQESEPAEESESEPSDVEPPAEEPPGEEPPDEEPQTEDAEPTDDDAGEEEPSEEPAPPELTPEEQAKIEEARRKREERQAKREARKAAEEAKARERKAKEASKEERQEGKVLAKAYAALDREELKNALQGFRAYIDLAGKDAFAGYMGVARTQLALGEPASAIESALEAAKLTEVGAQKAEALIFAGDASLMARPRDEETLQPLPGTELYETTAVRFFLQALTADPQDNSEAIERARFWLIALEVAMTLAIVANCVNWMLDMRGEFLRDTGIDEQNVLIVHTEPWAPEFKDEEFVHVQRDHSRSGRLRGSGDTSGAHRKPPTWLRGRALPW